MIKLRIARTDETNAVCAFFDAVIENLAGAQYGPGWERDIYPDRAMLEGFIQRGEMYIGEADGQIACTAALNRKQDNPACLEIHLLAVHPDCTGRGYGKAMVRHAFATAAAMGLNRICLDVTDGNLPAERLYTGMGFQYVQTRRDWFTPDDYMDFREFICEIK